MTGPWRKVFRDLWGERARALLVVLAIAVGLTAFLAVLSTFAILRRELNSGYLATNPASAVLLTDVVDDELLASVVARDDVEDADARRVLTGKFRTGPGETCALVLFVIRDFEHLRISTLDPEEGEWPPAPGSVLLERDAFQVAKSRIGDVALIETADGRAHALRVSGRVHDVGQAQARMENAVYGYVTPETAAMLGEPAALDRLVLMASGDRFDEARVRRVASDVRRYLESAGHPVRQVDVPVPGEHPHAKIMGVLLLAMAAFGAFALVLSGVLVANLLLALMAAERRQIGVMKAIGGTPTQIARIYLAQASLYGVAALALAVPAGLLGGRELSRRFAVLLNFDLESLAVPAWVFLLVFVVALIVPLCAAAWPVHAAISMSVRAAVSAVGVDPTRFGSGRLERWVCGVGTAGRPLLLGVRNSLRRRTRTVLTLSTIALAGSFFVSALSVRDSMVLTADREFAEGVRTGIDRYSFDQHMLMIYVFLLVASAVLATVGGLGMATSTSLNVLERRREFGVLRAIGATPAAVGAIVVVEAAFVAGVGWVAAVLMAWPITALLGRFLTAALFPAGLDITLAPAGVAGWLALSLGIAVLASFAPALQVSRHSIRESISHE